MGVNSTWGVATAEPFLAKLLLFVSDIDRENTERWSLWDRRIMKHPRKASRLCRMCRARPPVFNRIIVRNIISITATDRLRRITHRAFRRDKDHDLCRQCWRSLRDSLKLRVD